MAQQQNGELFVKAAHNIQRPKHLQGNRLFRRPIKLTPKLINELRWLAFPLRMASAGQFLPHSPYMPLRSLLKLFNELMVVQLCEIQWFGFSVWAATGADPVDATVGAVP